MSLTLRQRSFVDAYAQTGNGAASAVRAGYSARSAKVTASRLLTKANVQAALRARQRQAERQLEVSRQRVLEELQEAVALAKAKGNPLAIVAAWREVAKICGYYAGEHRSVDLNACSTPTQAAMARMSDAELLSLQDV